MASQEFSVYKHIIECVSEWVMFIKCKYVILFFIALLKKTTF